MKIKWVNLKFGKNTYQQQITLYTMNIIINRMFLYKMWFTLAVELCIYIPIGCIMFLGMW